MLAAATTPADHDHRRLGAREPAAPECQRSLHGPANSAAPDALTGVASKQGMAMLHQSTNAGGMAGMEDMDSLALPAHQAVALAPGGTHIMLMDLKQALRAGDMLTLTLHFAHAPEQTITVPVRPVGASGP